MPQSEDKIALEELEIEIKGVDDYIELLKLRIETFTAKSNVLKERKKSIENYLNSDND